jgi:hypothetical protein
MPHVKTVTLRKGTWASNRTYQFCWVPPVKCWLCIADNLIYVARPALWAAQSRFSFGYAQYECDLWWKLWTLSGFLRWILIKWCREKRSLLYLVEETGRIVFVRLVYLSVYRAMQTHGQQKDRRSIYQYPSVFLLQRNAWRLHRRGVHTGTLLLMMLN